MRTVRLQRSYRKSWFSSQLLCIESSICYAYMGDGTVTDA